MNLTARRTHRYGFGLGQSRALTSVSLFGTIFSALCHLIQECRVNKPPLSQGEQPLAAASGAVCAFCILFSMLLIAIPDYCNTKKSKKKIFLLFLLSWHFAYKICHFDGSPFHSCGGGVVIKGWSRAIVNNFKLQTHFDGLKIGFF